MAALLVLLALGMGAVTAFYVLWWNSRLRRTLDSIPGPKALPLLGNGLQLKTDGYEGSEQLIEYCRDYGRSRGIARLWLGTIPSVLLSRANTVEVLLKSSTHLKKSFMYEYILPWMARGLLTSLPDKWQVRRKLLTPAFHFKILTDFLPGVNEQARILADLLTGKAEQTGPFDIYPYLTRCTLDIICETTMGRNNGAQRNFDSDYVWAVHKIAEIILARIKTPLWQWDFIFYRTKAGREYRRCLDILHGFTRSVIKERSAELDQQLVSHTGKVTMEDLQTDKPFLIGKQRRLAFLDMLLVAAKGGADLSHADIQEEVDTFMFAGHDTTASAAGWTLYCLGRHPDIQRRIHEELDAVFGGDDRDVTMADLGRMKYLECVIKEAMRLFPPVPMVARETEEDCVIGGYTVLKGTTAMLITTALHLDPEHFPDPNKFDPDRWLPENSAGRHPYCYIPFSAGSRNCIGQKFAMNEEKVLMSVVLRKFSVRSHQSYDEVRPAALGVLRPEGALLVSLDMRQ